VHNKVNGTAVGKASAWRVELRSRNGSARAEIERLFLIACATLDTITDRDARHFHVTTVWPLCPRDWHAYAPEVLDDEPERFVPSPADHDRMLDVLAWGRALDRLQWKSRAMLRPAF
jgi:hypothetical protein